MWYMHVNYHWQKRPQGEASELHVVFVVSATHFMASSALYFCVSFSQRASKLNLVCKF